MTTKKVFLALAILAGLTAVLTAQRLRGGDSETIDGTWTLDQLNAAGQLQAQLLITFSQGGGVVADGNAARPTLRSPWHGTWDRLSYRDFIVTMVRWNFDEAGNVVGFTKRREVITVDPTLDGFGGRGKGEDFDRSGNRTPASLREFTTRARRLPVEAIE